MGPPDDGRAVLLGPTSLRYDQIHLARGGLPYILSGKHMTFMWNGDSPPSTSLMTAADATLFQTIALTPVYPNDARYWAWFLWTLNLLSEIPATNNDTLVMNIPIYVPCVNGLVYLFGDLSHPAIALQQIKNIQQAFPAAHTASLNRLVKWLKVACQRDATGSNIILLTSWLTVQDDDIVLHQWDQDRHDLMLPHLPLPEPIPVAPTPTGLTESNARAIIRDEARTAKETQLSRADYCHIADLG